jgi:hypothetical protein
VKVSELRKTLTELARLLDAAGAAKPAKDVAGFADGLAGFDDDTLDKVLKLAEAGRKPPPAPRAPRAAKAKVDPAELLVEIEYLDRHMDAADVTPERIAAVCDKVDKLTKPQVVQAAAVVGLAPAKSAAKGAVAGELRKHLLERKSTAARRAMADRPPGESQ